MPSRVGSARSPHAPRDTLHKPSNFRGRPRLWEGLARFFFVCFNDNNILLEYCSMGRV